MQAFAADRSYSQGACAAVFVPLQTEKVRLARRHYLQQLTAELQYYDLSGSLTFISTVLFSLYFPAKRPGMATPSLFSFHARQLLQTAGVMLWAGRLGSFLYQRIQRSGSDSRFDEIKKSPLAFTGAWMAQATWVSLTALPVFITNSIPASAHPALGLKDLATVALWVGALTFEVIADRQKSAWREAKNNKVRPALSRFLRPPLTQANRSTTRSSSRAVRTAARRL